jgi:hypothetical protein
MILSLISLLSSCKAQNLSSSIQEQGHQVEISIHANLMKVDKLGNIYLVSDENELIKYNANGEQVHSYSNNILGSLSIIDVTNPLKLILFYPDYQLVISLDKNLAEIGRYDLQAFGYNEIQTVGLSNDNHIWLYDPESFSLRKINEQGELVLESFSLVSENLAHLRPTSIKERQNKVYINDPELGILSFDNYGQFVKHIPVLGVLDFQIESGGLIYFDGKAMFRYDPFLFESHRVNLGEEWISDAKSVFLRKEHMYILLKNGVKKLQIEE